MTARTIITPYRLPPGVKPTYPVEVDWDSPAAKSLAFCLWFNGSSIYDLVSGKEVLTTNDEATCSYSIGSGGTAIEWSAGAADKAIETTELQPITTSDGSGTGDFSVLYVGAPEAAGLSSFAISQRYGSGSFEQWNIGVNQSEAPTTVSGSIMLQTYAGAFTNCGAANMVDGNEHAYLWRRDGTTHEMYRDGVLARSLTGTVRDVYHSDQHFSMGGYADGGGNSGNCHTGPNYFYAGWNRALTDSEARSISRDPYAFLKPTTPQTQIITPASTPNDRVWIV